MFNKDIKVPLQEAELVGTSSSNKAYVCDTPGKADVVADTVNIFEAVEAEAVDVADDTKDEAKATDANVAEKAKTEVEATDANRADESDTA